MKETCEDDEIMRRAGYSYKKNGTTVHVKPRCAKKSNLTPAQLKLYTRKQKRYIQKPESKVGLKCPPGQIPRAGYDVKKGSGVSYKVKPGCIPDVGAPGRGPNVIQVKPVKGFLSDHGYKTDLPDSKRQSILTEIIQKINYDYNFLIRELNLRANLNKPLSTVPKTKDEKERQMKRKKLHETLRKDMKFVQNQKKTGKAPGSRTKSAKRKTANKKSSNKKSKK